MILYMHGHLKDFAPEGLTLEVDNIPQLLRALESIYPEFREKLTETQRYAFIRKSGEQIQEVSESELQFPLNADELHIIPSIEGSGFEIAAAMVLSGSLGAVGYWVVGIGLNILSSLAIGAVIGALTPKPKSEGAASPKEEAPSYIFRGAQNTTQPGTAIPLVYGEVLTGSVVISVGVSTEDIPIPIPEPEEPEEPSGN